MDEPRWDNLRFRGHVKEAHHEQSASLRPWIIAACVAVMIASGVYVLRFLQEQRDRAELARVAAQMERESAAFLRSIESAARPRPHVQVSPQAPVFPATVSRPGQIACINGAPMRREANGWTQLPGACRVR